MRKDVYIDPLPRRIISFHTVSGWNLGEVMKRYGTTVRMKVGSHVVVPEYNMVFVWSLGFAVMMI